MSNITQRLKGKKIAFFVNDLNFFYRHRIGIVRRLAREGANIIIIGNCNFDQIINEISMEGFRCYSLKVSPWGTNPFHEIITILNLIQILKKERPDILDNITIKPILYGTISGLFLKIPAIVNNFSGLGTIFRSPGIFNKIKRLILIPILKLILDKKNISTCFQNDSDLSLLNNLLQLKHNQLHLIAGSGIELNEYECTDLPPPPISILLPARLLIDKGIQEFCEAAIEINKLDLNIKFLIAGEIPTGHPRALSSADYEKYSHSNAIRFMGHIQNMSAAYDEVHIICLPSYHEGRSRVLLEALAKGRPIITSDIGGCKEMCIPDFNGWLVKSQNTESLKLAILNATKNFETLCEYGKNSRKLVENSASTVENVTEAYINLYQRM